MRRRAPPTNRRFGRSTQLALALAGWAMLLGSGGAEAVTPPASQAAANRFDIWEFLVVGNHVLPQTTVEAAVYPYLGPHRDLATVKEAAAALEGAYKHAGYGAAYVDIPPQKVTQGVVRLRVTEGRVESVRVQGARYFSDRQIRAALPALSTGETPLLTALQSQLSKLNSQTPDRSVTPVLKAGSRPGTLDVDLDVKDKLPLHASLAYDNRHTADTTPNRLTASISYNNLWQRLDSLSFLYQTAPADRKNATVESASYLAHVPDASGLAAFSYTHTSSNVLALGTLGVLGNGDIYGLHWLQPLASTPILTQSLDAGADYKSVRTEVFPDSTSNAASGNTPASSAPVTAPVNYLNWSATYSSAWHFPARTITASLAANFGVNGIVNSSGVFNNARYNASPDYLYLRFSGGAIQRLPGNFAVLGRISGQWADSPLVNNEQFSLGGEDTVRGYLEAETLGDSGVAGDLELHGPDFARFTKPVLSQLYLFAFIDAGVATLLDPLPGQEYHVNLWSTGGGLALAGPAGLSGSLDYAIPQENGIRTRKHAGRLDFSIHFGY